MTLSRPFISRLMAVALASMISLGGCTQREATGASPLQIPTKDDVALVDGQPVSISAFLAVRDSLKTPTTEVAFWICTASLAVQNQLQKSGKTIPMDSILTVGKYALGDATWEAANQTVKALRPETQGVPAPAEIRALLDSYLSRAVVQRNPRILAELH